MLEIKPITSNDHFVHPVQAVKAAHEQSQPGLHSPTLVTISPIARQMLKAETVRPSKASESLKEKVKRILSGRPILASSEVQDESHTSAGTTTES